MNRTVVLILSVSWVGVALIGAAVWLVEDPPPPLLGVEVSTVPGVSIVRVVDTGGYSVSERQTGMSARSLEARGATFTDLLCHAFVRPRGGIVAEVQLPEGRYDVIVAAYASGDELRTLLATAIRSAFGIAGTHEERLVPGYALECPTRSLPGFRICPTAGGEPLPVGAQSSSWFPSGGSLVFHGGMDSLARTLESMTNAPCYDETCMPGVYMAAFRWSTERGESLTSVLAAAGIQLVPTQRKESVLVLTRAAIEPDAARAPSPR